MTFPSPSLTYRPHEMHVMWHGSEKKLGEVSFIKIIRSIIIYHFVFFAAKSSSSSSSSSLSVMFIILWSFPTIADDAELKKIRKRIPGLIFLFMLFVASCVSWNWDIMNFKWWLIVARINMKRKKIQLIMKIYINIKIQFMKMKVRILKFIKIIDQKLCLFC